jgi:hypothetical protein
MQTIDIEQLTLKQIREISSLTNHSSPQSIHPYKIGAKYFIRTVTMNHTGRLIEVGDKELVIEDAAWIADSGRFTQALESGVFSEVEMFPKGRVIIGRGALVDAVEISNTPTLQK